MESILAVSRLDAPAAAAREASRKAEANFDF
jgi:hypothetical protein